MASREERDAFRSECDGRRAELGAVHTITAADAAVVLFQKKIGSPAPGSIRLTLEPQIEAASKTMLFALAATLKETASRAMEAFKSTRAGGAADARLLRMALLVEEVGELSEALAWRDAASTLDALADIEYVNRGTAVSYSMPLDEAFWEVALANSTKHGALEAAVCKVGDRGKGPTYRPPDMHAVLKEHRALCAGKETA